MGIELKSFRFDMYNALYNLMLDVLIQCKTPILRVLREVNEVIGRKNSEQKQRPPIWRCLVNNC